MPKDLHQMLKYIQSHFQTDNVLDSVNNNCLLLKQSFLLNVNFFETYLKIIFTPTLQILVCHSSRISVSDSECDELYIYKYKRRKIFTDHISGFISVLMIKERNVPVSKQARALELSYLVTFYF